MASDLRFYFRWLPVGNGPFWCSEQPQSNQGWPQIVFGEEIVQFAEGVLCSDLVQPSDDRAVEFGRLQDLR
jgi:hypothetical protein